MTYTQAKECLQDIDRSELEDLLKTYGEEVIEAALESDIPPHNIAEAYQGEYKDDEDFAQSLAEDLGELPKDNHWPHYCIDWEYAARELMMDYCEHNGHYFRNL